MNRGTITRLKRQIEEYQRSRPPVVEVICQRDGESLTSWGLRLSDAQGRLERTRATGRQAHILFVDRDDE